MTAKAMAIVNQKGGVGKTTTAVNLGAALAELSKRVLVVDIDPQGNTTSGLGVNRYRLKKCIYNVLIDGVPIEAVILPTSTPRLELVPATIQLAGAEIELVLAMQREVKLREAVQHVRENYDYILIDCPPSLGLLTLNALTAAHGVLIPVQCEYYALEGLSQLMNTVSLVQRHLNPSLVVSGALLTMFDPRTNLASQVVDEVRAYFKDKVYATVIPRNVRLSEAPSHGQSILAYDPKSKGAEVYMELAREVIERG
ncbi:MAG: Sporulation initiation inhibitor protein Soj [Firmicutes bacterium]|nr:Sporulation initiation inhibitor protein Soj [candidate division NPL-UPA2 bacterium]MBT9153665.1 Sporulation initiation inhibitor protein Soj [candidate division NPL-UPA2 bacterium]MBT9155118.1 Sporulation initiation inhibitor protein Soj [candidate division NPL-UPA2 bacterium]